MVFKKNSLGFNAHSFKQARTKAWLWLLRKARIYPWWIGATVFTLLFVVSLAFAGMFKPIDWITRLDYAGIVLSLISVCLAWTLAIIYWAHRKEAQTAVDLSGEVYDYSPKASLIISSGSKPQSAWHLRHLKPERAEFVWTDLTGEGTAQLQQTYSQIQSYHSAQLDQGTLKDIYDIRAIQDHCKRLLEEILRDHPSHEVCVDITSGTVLMSLGAFQAAEELGVTTIYLVGNYPEKRFLIVDLDNPQEARPIALTDHYKKAALNNPT